MEFLSNKIAILEGRLHPSKKGKIANTARSRQRSPSSPPLPSSPLATSSILPPKSYATPPPTSPNPVSVSSNSPSPPSNTSVQPSHAAMPPSAQVPVITSQPAFNFKTVQTRPRSFSQPVGMSPPPFLQVPLQQTKAYEDANFSHRDNMHMIMMQQNQFPIQQQAPHHHHQQQAQQHHHHHQQQQHVQSHQFERMDFSHTHGQPRGQHLHQVASDTVSSIKTETPSRGMQSSENSTMGSINPNNSHHNNNSSFASSSSRPPAQPASSSFAMMAPRFINITIDDEGRPVSQHMRRTISK